MKDHFVLLSNKTSELKELKNVGLTVNLLPKQLFHFVKKLNVKIVAAVSAVRCC